MYSRKVNEEMNTLSKEVFGTTSKWKKMIDKGVVHSVMEEATRLNHDGTSEKTKVPKKHVGPNKGELNLFELYHYTLESVREFMLDVKAKRQQLADAIKRINEEEKAAKATKDAALKDATGSSV